jgi:hypothetical protein
LCRVATISNAFFWFRGGSTDYFPGGKGLGKTAVVKGLAAPANAGADADLTAGASGYFGSDGDQSTEHDKAQPVAKELAAAGAGIWRTSLHGNSHVQKFRPCRIRRLIFFCPTLDIPWLAFAVAKAEEPLRQARLVIAFQSSKVGCLEGAAEGRGTPGRFAFYGSQLL